MRERDQQKWSPVLRPIALPFFKRGVRTNTLATLRGSIERIESHSDTYRPDRVALGHADADATLQGGLALGAMHEVFAAGRHSAAATGFVTGLMGRAAARRSRSAPPRDGARGRRGGRVADRRRRAGLRCARRRGAGSLGRGATTGSRRQPQADAGRADVRRDRPGAAGGGGAIALDRGNQMDRARGAFAARRAARKRVGRTGVRRAACPQPPWPCRAMDHGMEM